jgi:hypothetical protein
MSGCLASADSAWGAQRRSVFQNSKHSAWSRTDIQSTDTIAHTAVWLGRIVSEQPSQRPPSPTLSDTSTAWPRGRRRSISRCRINRRANSRSTIQSSQKPVIGRNRRRPQLATGEIPGRFFATSRQRGRRCIVSARRACSSGWIEHRTSKRPASIFRSTEYDAFPWRSPGACVRFRSERSALSYPLLSSFTRVSRCGSAQTQRAGPGVARLRRRLAAML